MLSNSPEESPSASFPRRRAGGTVSPVSLTDERALPVSVEAEAGASLGRAVCLGRWRRVLGRAGVLAGHCSVGPVQQLWPSFVSYFVCFIISPNCVVIQKYVAPSI